MLNAEIMIRIRNRWNVSDSGLLVDFSKVLDSESTCTKNGSVTECTIKSNIGESFTVSFDGTTYSSTILGTKYSVSPKDSEYYSTEQSGILSNAISSVESLYMLFRLGHLIESKKILEEIVKQYYKVTKVSSNHITYLFEDFLDSPKNIFNTAELGEVHLTMFPKFNGTFIIDVRGTEYETAKYGCVVIYTTNYSPTEMLEEQPNRKVYQLKWLESQL